MKVYGFDDTGVARGDLVAATISAIDLMDGLDVVARLLGWEEAFTSVTEARAALINYMRADGADAEQIRLVQSMRACDVPIVEAL